MVVNNSKVLPARIVGVKQPTGAVCELLLLRQVKGDQWECLAKPGKRMQPGTKVSFGDGSLTAVVDETMEDGNKYVTFYYDTETLYEKLDEFGKMPLPPYITKQLEDQSQYQTVYAKDQKLYQTLLAHFSDKAEQERKLSASGVRLTDSGDTGSRSESLSSTAAESLQRAVGNYLKRGNGDLAQALAAQYTARMTPAQRQRFEKLLGQYGMTLA